MVETHIATAAEASAGNFVFATALSPGDYSVTVTNTDGCASSGASVTLDPAPGVPSSPAVVASTLDCGDTTGTITVNTPISGFTYTLSNVSNPSAIALVETHIATAAEASAGNFVFATALSPGDYSVTVTSLDGCKSTAAEVSIAAAPPTPVAPAVTPSTDCSGGDGSVSVSGLDTSVTSVLLLNSGNTEVYNVNVTVAGNGNITLGAAVSGVSVNGSTLVFGNLGADTYTVTASDGFCTLNKLATVQDGKPNIPEVSEIQPTCAALGQIIVNNPEPGEYVLYEVTTSTEVDRKTYSTSDTGDLIFENLGEGEYEVTFRNLNTNCESEASQQITLNGEPDDIEAPELSDIALNTCGDGETTVDLTVLVPTSIPDLGRPAVLQLTWHSDTPATAGNELADPTAVGAGTYYAAFFDTNSGCYGDTQPVTVTIISKPLSPTVEVEQPTCEVGTGTITVIVDSDSEGFTYTLTSDNGNEEELTVNEDDERLVFADLDTGTYRVTVDDGTCVSEANLVTISLSNIDFVSLEGDFKEYIFMISCEKNFILPKTPEVTASDGSEVLFTETILQETDGDCGSSTLIERKWTASSCGEVSRTQIIQVVCAVEVYNGLSPDSTPGINDILFLKGIECYPNNVKIFNRWGILVFEKDNYNNEDKVFRGISEERFTIEQKDKLPSGTYFYIIQYKYTDSNAPGGANSSRMLEQTGYIYISR